MAEFSGKIISAEYMNAEYSLINILKKILEFKMSVQRPCS